MYTNQIIKLHILSPFRRRNKLNALIFASLRMTSSLLYKNQYFVSMKTIDNPSPKILTALVL